MSCFSHNKGRENSHSSIISENDVLFFFTFIKCNRKNFKTAQSFRLHIQTVDVCSDPPEIVMEHDSKWPIFSCDITALYNKENTEVQSTKFQPHHKQSTSA